YACGSGLVRELLVGGPGKSSRMNSLPQVEWGGVRASGSGLGLGMHLWERTCPRAFGGWLRKSSRMNSLPQVEWGGVRASGSGLGLGMDLCERPGPRAFGGWLRKSSRMNSRPQVEWGGVRASGSGLGICLWERTCPRALGVAPEKLANEFAPT